MDVIDKARSQLSALQRKIAELQSSQDRLKQFISTFEELKNTPDELTDWSSVYSESSPISKLAALASGSIKPAKVRIADAVESVLVDGTSRHTRVLLMHLETLGVDVGGKDKVLSLSAILSNDDRFQADRKIGWSLKTAEKARPESAATDSGLFVHSGGEPDPTP